MRSPRCLPDCRFADARGAPPLSLAHRLCVGRRHLSYRAALDLIGRLQAAMVAAGLAKGQPWRFSAPTAETWCAGVAAQGLGLVTTWLHPLGSLGDHLDVIEDAGAEALIVDPGTHAQRGGELAAGADRACGRAHHGTADYGRDCGGG